MTSSHVDPYKEISSYEENQSVLPSLGVTVGQEVCIHWLNLYQYHYENFYIKIDHVKSTASP